MPPSWRIFIGGKAGNERERFASVVAQKCPENGTLEKGCFCKSLSINGQIIGEAAFWGWHDGC
jgi:hypothetical protein